MAHNGKATPMQDEDATSPQPAPETAATPKRGRRFLDSERTQFWVAWLLIAGFHLGIGLVALLSFMFWVSVLTHFVDDELSTRAETWLGVGFWTWLLVGFVFSSAPLA